MKDFAMIGMFARAEPVARPGLHWGDPWQGRAPVDGSGRHGSLNHGPLLPFQNAREVVRRIHGLKFGCPSGTTSFKGKSCGVGDGAVRPDGFLLVLCRPRRVKLVART